MLTTITLIVSLCSNVTMTEIKAKKAELEARNPGAKVSVRMDSACKSDRKRK